jgi:hypothetical protein
MNRPGPADFTKIVTKNYFFKARLINKRSS